MNQLMGIQCNCAHAVFLCSEPLKIVEAGASDHMLPVGTKGNENLYVTLEAQQRPAELILKGCLTTKSLQSINLRKVWLTAILDQLKKQVVLFANYIDCAMKLEC
jgi:hypothetical protein